VGEGRGGRWRSTRQRGRERKTHVEGGHRRQRVRKQMEKIEGADGKYRGSRWKR
jgi:hypothetical protein